MTDTAPCPPWCIEDHSTPGPDHYSGELLEVRLKLHPGVRANRRVWPETLAVYVTSVGTERAQVGLSRGELLSTETMLTPAEARRVGRALVAAADRAEGPKRAVRTSVSS